MLLLSAKGLALASAIASASSRKDSYTEHGAEGLFGKDAGLGGNVSEERGSYATVARSRGQCSVAPRESASSTWARRSDCASSGQRAEVCVWISINAKLRDAMLQAGKKFVIDGRFNIHTFDCNAHASRHWKRRRR